MSPLPVEMVNTRSGPGLSTAGATDNPDPGNMDLDLPPGDEAPPASDAGGASQLEETTEQIFERL
jgi:hypothetical protein